MKIKDLTGKGMYTSNVYFILGSYNSIADKNTLIDVGTDYELIKRIEQVSTGVGKKPVEQVVITHNHSDHAGLLPVVKAYFKPEVCAFSTNLCGADHVLNDGEVLHLGDRFFEVLHTPGHSQDSICLYCEDEKVLFVGDTNIRIDSTHGAYDSGFVETLEKLCCRDVQAIYFGHGAPLLKGCNERIATTLANVKNSRYLCKERSV